MGFSSSVGRLSERVPWKNSYWNTLIDDIDSAMSNLTGSDLAEDIVLGASQNIDGNGNSLHGFRRYFGFGASGYSVVDVTSYGAGTGSYNDKDFIQAAIDDLPSTGGLIFFPPGSYNVEGTVWLGGTSQDKANVTLLGSGPSTHVYTAGTCDNVPTFMLGYRSGYSSGMQLANMRIEGSNTTDGYHAGASIEGASGARIVKCHFEDIEGSGIYAIGSRNCMIHQCNFIDMGNTSNSDEGCGIYHGGSIGGVVRVSEITGLRITNCHFADSDRNGIRLSAASNVIIANCSFYAHGEDGIMIETLTRSGVKNVIIKNSSFYGNADDGIACEARTPGTSITGLLISGNTIAGGGAQDNGISLYGADTSPINFFVISGNVCQDHVLHGIYLRNGVRYGSVTANTCNNNDYSESGDGCGILLSGGATEPVEWTTVTGNACGDDRASGSRTQGYGILLDTNSENCVCVGNAVYNNVTKNLDDLGTDNDVSHNPGA